MSIPKPKIFWPVTIDATNNKIDFREAADVADRTATIASGTYYSADTLVAAVKAALDAASLAADPWTITVDDATGLITFVAAGGTSFTFRFGSGANAGVSPYLILGFYALNTASVGLSLTAPKQHQNGWYSPLAVWKDTGNFYEEPNTVVTVSIAGNVKSISETVLTYREIGFHFLPPEYTRIASEGASQTALERLWRTGRGRFRYWPDATVEGTYGDYFLDMSVLERGFTPERMFMGKEVYRVGPWKMRSYV